VNEGSLEESASDIEARRSEGKAGRKNSCTKNTSGAVRSGGKGDDDNPDDLNSQVGVLNVGAAS